VLAEMRTSSPWGWLFISIDMKRTWNLLENGEIVTMNVTEKYVLIGLV
jgi:hypothetical protein